MSQSYESDPARAILAILAEDGPCDYARLDGLDDLGPYTPEQVGEALAGLLDAPGGALARLDAAGDYSITPLGRESLR